MTSFLDRLVMYQQCEQKFVYSELNGLSLRYEHAEPKDMLKAMLGTYVEALYSTPLSNDPHRTALESMLLLWQDRVGYAVSACRAFGNEGLALAYENTLDTASRIADHYNQVRFAVDAQVSNPPLPILWDHRVTIDRPDVVNGPELSDYRKLAGLDEYHDELILRINYIRPELPHEPSLNKNGTVSRNISVTTWPMYAAAIARAGGRLSDYEDMRLKLEGRETEYFFPRMDVLVTRREITRIRQSFERIELATSELAAAQYMSPGRETEPMRHFGHYCPSCPYKPLCKAWLAGDDQQSIIDRLYNRA